MDKKKHTQDLIKEFEGKFDLGFRVSKVKEDTVKMEDVGKKAKDFLQKALEDIYQKGKREGHKIGYENATKIFSYDEAYQKGKEDGVREAVEVAKKRKYYGADIAVSVYNRVKRDIVWDLEQYLNKGGKE